MDRFGQIRSICWFQLCQIYKEKAYGNFCLKRKNISVWKTDEDHTILNGKEKQKIYLNTLDWFIKKIKRSLTKIIRDSINKLLKLQQQKYHKQDQNLGKIFVAHDKGLRITMFQKRNWNWALVANSTKTWYSSVTKVKQNNEDQSFNI